MSNQILVPRSNGSGSIGTNVKRWGNSYFTSMSVDNVNLTGSFNGVYHGDGSNLTGIVATVLQPNYLDFKTGSDNPDYLEGRMFYDDTKKTLAYYNNESDVTLNIGQEEYIRVRNVTGATILNGSPVKMLGATGNRPNVDLAISEIHSGSIEPFFELIGVATHDIEDNTDGYVTTFGIVTMDTSNFNVGDTLYVSSSIGQLTNVRPSPPYDILIVGVVLIQNANTGQLFVNSQNAIHLHDITGMNVPVNPENNSIISYNSQTKYYDVIANPTIYGDFNTITTRISSSNYTLNGTEGRVGVKYSLTGSCEIQLPLLSNVIEDKKIIIKDEEGNSSTNNITLLSSGSNLIDGESSFIIASNYGAISLYASPSQNNWFIE